MGFVWFRPKSHRLPQRKASREKQRPGNPFFPKQPGRRMAMGMKDTTWREQGEQTRTQMGVEKNQESRVQKHPERTTVINEERSEESIGKN